MDLGFTRLDAARADAAPVPLDYFRLIASLSAMQAASRTAAAEARADAFAGADPVAALVELFTAGPEWAGAVSALDCSFHTATAVKTRGFAP